MDENAPAPRATPQVNIHQLAMAPSATKDAGFRPLSLLLWCVLALALYASWAFILPTRLWWNHMDTQVFLTLNTLAGSSRPAQIFWAILSSRLIDIIPGIILFLVFWSYLRGDGSLFFRRRCAESGAIIFSMLLTIMLGKILFDFPRPSPSLVLVPNHRLSELVPWAFVKDAAPASFPSDHALLYLMLGGLLWHFTGKSRGRVVLALGALMMMPRMASGAHWCTDIVVGAGALGMVMWAFVCFTPLGSLLVNLVEKILALPPFHGAVLFFESKENSRG